MTCDSSWTFVDAFPTAEEAGEAVPGVSSRLVECFVEVVGDIGGLVALLWKRERTP
jgi:hypothetical protein